mmetsp:Transcript_36260/g.100076  ORF Transcript_36260/g.100076 Transcript_36260/m.100076 type:complete len:216 (-) Transcript_36260:438-1085(-)
MKLEPRRNGSISMSIASAASMTPYLCSNSSSNCWRLSASAHAASTLSSIDFRYAQFDLHSASLWKYCTVVKRVCSRPIQRSRSARGTSVRGRVPQKTVMTSSRDSAAGTVALIVGAIAGARLACSVHGILYLESFLMASRSLTSQTVSTDALRLAVELRTCTRSPSGLWMKRSRTCAHQRPKPPLLTVSAILRHLARCAAGSAIRGQLRCTASSM